MTKVARGRALALVTMLTLAVAACSGGDDASGGPTTTRPPPTPSTTQPPASAGPAAQAIVEDQVVEATALFDELIQDPSRLDDPNDDTLDRLREIYTEDSSTPAAVERGVRELAQAGERYRPAASGIFREVSIYQWEPAADDDTLRFDTCSLIDRERVDAAGTVLEADARVVFAAGEAHRVQGEWRFFGLSNDVSREIPLDPGTANAGFCKNLQPGDPVPTAGG